MNNWRLSQGAFAFIPRAFSNGEKVLFLCNIENKKDQTLINKVAARLNLKYLNKIWINNPTGFKLRFGNNMIIQVKHPELPNPDEWYTVMNHMEGMERWLADEYKQLLDSGKYENGEFQGEFEPAYTDEYPAAVKFISPSSKNYKYYKEEMERRTNLGFFKRTTKWTPGERYDIEKASLYYLGEINKRNLKDNVEPVRISLLSIPDSCTVENIWDNAVFATEARVEGKDVIFTTTKKISAANVSTFLTIPDGVNIFENFRPKIFENMLESCKNVEEIAEGISVTSYKHLSLIVEQFFYILPGEEGKDIKEIAAPYVDEIKEIILSGFRSIVQTSPYALSDKPVENRAKDLLESFIRFNVTKDVSFDRLMGILKAMEIDLKKLSENFLTGFVPEAEFLNSLENFIKAENYVKIVLRGDRYIDLRKSIIPRDSTHIPTLSDYFHGDYESEILELINYAINNYGEGIQSLKYDGKLKVYILEIGVKDIWTKYHKTGVKIPTGLINDIISTKAFSNTIVVDEDWDKLVWEKK